MTIRERIKDENLQYNIDREATKTLARSSDNID